MRRGTRDPRTLLADRAQRPGPGRAGQAVILIAEAPRRHLGVVLALLRGGYLFKTEIFDVPGVMYAVDAVDFIDPAIIVPDVGGSEQSVFAIPPLLIFVDCYFGADFAR